MTVVFLIGSMNRELADDADDLGFAQIF